ncbi:MAG: DUF3570 domain-containing protein [Deltaproteobacteria bacterium]|nr:MAG: DUF3570 domain-containing protein [Deltaproteobacteria bacterium]
MAKPSAEPDGPVGVEAVGRVNVYVDNDGNRIVTPLTAVTATLDEGKVILDAHGSVDIMTCASVDVLSAATPRGYFQEVRKEAGGDASVDVAGVLLSAGAVYSEENDYSSISGNFGVTKELFQKNTTVALGYSFTDSNVGRSHDPTFDEDLDSHTVTASVTQVLSRSLVGQVSYFLGYLDGFQSSPYRRVRVASGVTTPESTPGTRLRNALALRLRAALAPEHFLSGDYRAYLDDWGLVSHTAEVGYTWQATPWLSWRLRDRVYLQSGADFYAWTYDSPRRYMTADRELGSFWGNLVGLRASFEPSVGRTQKLSIDLKFDFMYQKFADFPVLPERLMYVTELGATWAF